MDEAILKVAHLHDRDPELFERRVNQALDQIADDLGLVSDIKYAIDRSGDTVSYGALIIYELPSATI